MSLVVNDPDSFGVCCKDLSDAMDATLIPERFFQSLTEFFICLLATQGQIAVQHFMK